MAIRLPEAVRTTYTPSGSYNWTKKRRTNYTRFHRPVAASPPLNPGPYDHVAYKTACGLAFEPEQVLWPEDVAAPLFPLCEEGCW